MVELVDGIAAKLANHSWGCFDSFESDGHFDSF